jgi:phage virion morphogenesis protein
MASLEFIIDDEAVMGALSRMAAVGARPGPLLAVIGERIVISTKRRFESNIAPDGSAWAPLNPAYAAIRRPTPILVQSGLLRDSVHYELGAHSVRVGSSMIYAAIHQYGGVIKPKQARALMFCLGAGGGIVRVQSVRIPARPYLGISIEDRAAIIEDIQGYIEAEFAG